MLKLSRVTLMKPKQLMSSNTMKKRRYKKSFWIENLKNKQSWNREWRNKKKLKQNTCEVWSMPNEVPNYKLPQILCLFL